MFPVAPETYAPSLVARAVARVVAPLLPSFLTGRSTAKVGFREKELNRHHLAAAFLLPSVTEERREVVFTARRESGCTQKHLINATHEDKLEGRSGDAFFNAKLAEQGSQRASATEGIQRLTRATAKKVGTAVQVFELENRARTQKVTSRPQPNPLILNGWEWSHAYRTFWLDPEGWSNKQIISLEAVSSSGCVPSRME